MTNYDMAKDRAEWKARSVLDYLTGDNVDDPDHASTAVEEAEELLAELQDLLAEVS